MAIGVLVVGARRETHVCEAGRRGAVEMRGSWRQGHTHSWSRSWGWCRPSAPPAEAYSVSAQWGSFPGTQQPKFAWRGWLWGSTKASSRESSRKQAGRPLPPPPPSLLTLSEARLLRTVSYTSWWRLSLVFHPPGASVIMRWLGCGLDCTGDKVSRLLSGWMRVVS